MHQSSSSVAAIELIFGAITVLLTVSVIIIITTTTTTTMCTHM
jgi:hypothetical protein